MANQVDEALNEINDARKAVVQAEQAYSKGGSCVAVNKANARLAAAQSGLREATSNLVPNDK